MISLLKSLSETAWSRAGSRALQKLHLLSSKPYKLLIDQEREPQKATHMDSLTVTTS